MKATLRPDVVMCPTDDKKVTIIEFTVPWVEGIPAASECRQLGWTAILVSYRGFVGKFTIQNLHAMEMTGTSLKRPLKSWRRRQSSLFDLAMEEGYELWLKT